MKEVTTFSLLAICGYLVYRFGLYAYRKGLSDGFEIVSDTLNDIEDYSEKLLERQESESYRFYYVKGNRDAAKQIKEIVTNYEKIGG
ncbi:hypothetical protein [Enterococcus casseliflavus]|uniref:hypothetical protein n=1 Tax=Enterococcus casseliflavus TaxID=37734 RepID=UPI0022E7973F|nr:hypothetical protein [Enterococcus casseliflavus]